MESRVAPRSSTPERSSRSRRAAVACQKCRQAKVRCGMNNPPCARCNKLGFDCIVDVGFRRVNRKDRVEELEAHLQELQGLVRQNTDPLSPLNSTGRRTQTSSCQDSTQGANKRSQRDANLDSQPTCENVTSETTNSSDDFSTSMSFLELDEDHVDHLLQIYFKDYHHFLPFLDPRNSAEQIFYSSRLLFYSLLAVAARQYRPACALLSRLIPILTNLVESMISSTHTELANIQGLLLVACWPLPNFHFWTDKSPIIANLAMTLANRLGLHRPGYEFEYTNKHVTATPTNRLAGIKTWLACLVLCQVFSSAEGICSAVTFRHWTAQQACKGILDIPDELRDNLLIQECSNEVITALSQNPMHPFGMPSANSLLSELSRLEQMFELAEKSLSKLSFINTLRLACAKLSLQCVYFLDEVPAVQRLQGMLRAYSTACSLLTTAISSEDAHEQLCHAPFATLRTLFRATIVVFRVLHSSLAQEQSNLLDYSQGHVLYKAGLFAIRQSAVRNSEKEIHSRTADMMGNLWRWGASNLELRSQAPRLMCQSRLGSSIVYDCLLIARKSNLFNHKGRPSKDIHRSENGNQNAGNSMQRQEEPISTPSSYFQYTPEHTQASSIDWGQLDACDLFQIDLMGSPLNWDFASMTWNDFGVGS